MLDQQPAFVVASPGSAAFTFLRAVVSSRVAASLCLATAAPTVAQAASYQVLNLADSGTGSLRDAINLANANNGLDAITFPNLNGTVTLTSGALKIKDSVSIDGNSTVIIDGNNASTVFYPYSPDPNNPIDVTIANLTIQNAHSTDSGGAIDSNSVNLSVENCVIQDNVAQGSGGGIYAGGTADANISVVSSIIQNNNALTGSGGGIALGGGNTTFSMTTTTVVGNYAANNAGGIVVVAGPLTTGTIANSAILDNNSNNSGAGVYFQSSGDLFIQNSNISGNKTPANTAGLYAKGIGSQGGNVVVDSSTLSNNIGSQGAAVQTWHGATLAMTASTVVGNVAPSGGSGGLLIGATYGGPATITDCTITGNTGPRTGGIAVASGANIIVESSTITGNTSTQANGGGVFFYNGTTGVLHNSIIAQNAAATPPNQIGGQISAYVDVSFSLVSDINDVVANSNVVIVANASNVLGQDPNLSPIGDHGGPTATFLPAPDSPVVNAGDPNQASLPPYDQRGLTRVVQGVNDMGSVELQLCGGGTLETQFGCAGSTTGTTTGSSTTGGTTTGTTTSGTTTGTTTSGTTTTTTTGTTTSGTTNGGTTATTTTSGTTGGTTTATTTGGTTSSTTTSGTATATTTGGSKGNGGSSGCAAAPTANNPFAGAGFAAAALGLLRRRRQRK